MARSRRWENMLRDAADLQEESLPGEPLVEILGNSRVLIEHHRGVTEYTRERITVQVKRGEVCILGDRLELAKMTEQLLVVSGCVYGVNLQRW